MKSSNFVAKQSCYYDMHVISYDKCINIFLKRYDFLFGCIFFSKKVCLEHDSSLILTCCENDLSMYDSLISV